MRPEALVEVLGSAGDATVVHSAYVGLTVAVHVHVVLLHLSVAVLRRALEPAVEIVVAAIARGIAIPVVLGDRIDTPVEVAVRFSARHQAAIEEQFFVHGAVAVAIQACGSVGTVVDRPGEYAGQCDAGQEGQAVRTARRFPGCVGRRLGGRRRYALPTRVSTYARSRRPRRRLRRRPDCRAAARRRHSASARPAHAPASRTAPACAPHMCFDVVGGLIDALHARIVRLKPDLRKRCVGG